MPSREPEQNFSPAFPARVLNFLWLNLDLPAPPDPEDGSIREPLPAKYIDSIRRAGEAQPETKILLWIDSRRLTARQRDYLEAALEEGRPNIRLKDLRAIPAYDKEPLYNQAEGDPAWRRCGKSALIWRQVDAAKVLVSLQGDFDQSFFADLDHANLDAGAPKVQAMLEKRGLVIGSGLSSGGYFENQLWGFTRSRRGFFEGYYLETLKSAYRGENGYNALLNRVDSLLLKKESMCPSEICLEHLPDGSQAEQTGHRWQDGSGGTAEPRRVDNGELTRVFNARSTRMRPDNPAPEVAWAPSALQPRLTALRLASRLRNALKKSM
jgi:hypothetical protein